jgi:hypothetical protein
MDAKELIGTNTNSITINNGEELYNRNRHYRMVVELMENPTFAEFFNQYGNDWTELKTMIMFMKVYAWIDKWMIKHDISQNTPLAKLSLLDTIINDSKMREEVCNEMSNWSLDSCNSNRLTHVNL